MIVTETLGSVGVIRIDRPQRRNALDSPHCVQLRRAVEDAVGGGARALVVTGTGSSFCAGADLGEVYTDGFRDALYGALHAVADAPVPVIAAVNGPAIGAGTQLAIACDLRVAGPAAVFSVPTARIGLAVDPWTIRRLAVLAGGGAARALLLGSATLPADQAHARGLADRLGDGESALAWAREIAALAPLSLAYSKMVLNSGHGPAPGDDELLAAFDACWSSEDLEEARRARAQQRPPHFRGR